ncbi:MAG: hypothetical protein ABWX60_02155, partial [Aeromicrobium sp.]
RAFAFWSAGAWVVEPGDFVISVGASSRDLRLEQTIALTVPPIGRLDINSTVAEWLADPVGAGVLGGAFAQMGEVASAMTSADMLPMVESMPLRVLMGFGGQADGVVVAGQLLAQVEAVAGSSQNGA